MDQVEYIGTAMFNQRDLLPRRQVPPALLVCAETHESYGI